MNNFKSGSGNLDFGSSDDGGSDEGSSEDSPDHAPGRDESADTEQSPSRGTDSTGTAGEESASGGASASSVREESEEAATPMEKYPYFIRRNNVGDERETRLEIHVREKVAEREADFRSELADLLNASEVSKTDAREFALLAAFHNPERVAELMREEGFGTLQ